MPSSTMEYDWIGKACRKAKQVPCMSMAAKNFADRLIRKEESKEIFSFVEEFLTKKYKFKYKCVDPRDKVYSLSLSVNEKRRRFNLKSMQLVLVVWVRQC